LRDRVPIGAAILVYTSRAAVGIAVGATLVMVTYAVAKLIGYPIRDMALGDTAFAVWFGRYLACLRRVRSVRGLEARPLNRPGIATIWYSSCLTGGSRHMLKKLILAVGLALALATPAHADPQKFADEAKATAFCKPGNVVW